MSYKLSDNDKNAIEALLRPLFPNNELSSCNDKNPIENISPYLLKDIIFLLAMVCKKREWHQTGLCLSIGAEQMEAMIEQNSLSQSISNLKKNIRTN